MDEPKIEVVAIRRKDHDWYCEVRYAGIVAYSTTWDRVDTVYRKPEEAVAAIGPNAWCNALLNLMLSTGYTSKPETKQ